MLPSVDELMGGPALASLTSDHGHAAVLDAVRAVLERLRSGSDGENSMRRVSISRSRTSLMRLNANSAGILAIRCVR